MIYNVHTLTHIVDDVRLFGPLDNISAFPFENYLGHLKKLVRKPQYIITQVLKRLTERDLHISAKRQKIKSGFHREHFAGPLTAVASQQAKCLSQFKALYLPNFCIKLNDKDSCVIIGDSVCLVKNILHIRDSHNTGHIVYNQFIYKESFYSYPPITSDIVGTFKVSQLDLETCIGADSAGGAGLKPRR